MTEIDDRLDALAQHLLGVLRIIAAMHATDPRASLIATRAIDEERLLALMETRDQTLLNAPER